MLPFSAGFVCSSVEKYEQMNFVFNLLWPDLVVHLFFIRSFCYLVNPTSPSYFFSCVCVHAHIHTHPDMLVFPPCCIISQILRAATGSYAKIANRMLPYSSPLLLTLISLPPSFPSIVQGGTGSLVNMLAYMHTAHFQIFGGLDALEAWTMLNSRYIEQGFIIGA